MIDMTKLVGKIPQGALNIIRIIQYSGYEAYLVGGCVRDLILGVQPNDWDICSNATPEQIIKILRHNKIKYHTVGIEFGTVTALFKYQTVINDAEVVDEIEEYEITTYRAETTYSDGRHPDGVNFITNIVEDLKRRDFTINAIAYDPINNIVVDEFGGQSDIENKLIRAVGNPADRFDEDSLRILRALRFALRLGYKIERETSLCMHRQRGLLVNISKERVTAELEKMLTCGSDIKTYFMEYMDIIGTIIPELIHCFYFDQNNKYHKHDVYEHILNVVDACKTRKFEIKLAALLHDIGKPKTYTVDKDGWGHFYGHPDVSWEISEKVLTQDLRITREQLDRVLALVKYHDMHISDTKASMKRALNKHGEEYLKDWFILKQADMDDHVYPNKNWKFYMNIPKLNETMQMILDENACFSLKDLKLNGKDLMAELGIKPGKQIGLILNTLLNEVMDEKIDNDKEVLLSRAREILKSVGV